MTFGKKNLPYSISTIQEFLQKKKVDLAGKSPTEILNMFVKKCLDDVLEENSRQKIIFLQNIFSITNPVEQKVLKAKYIELRKKYDPSQFHELSLSDKTKDLYDRLTYINQLIEEAYVTFSTKKTSNAPEMNSHTFEELLVMLKDKKITIEEFLDLFQMNKQTRSSGMNNFRQYQQVDFQKKVLTKEEQQFVTGCGILITFFICSGCSFLSLTALNNLRQLLDSIF